MRGVEVDVKIKKVAGGPLGERGRKKGERGRRRSPRLSKPHR
jgi:hypothetical protein